MSVVERFVIHSWQEGFMISGTRFMEQASTLVADATTMRDRIKADLQVRFWRIKVEGDDQILTKVMLIQISTHLQNSSYPSRY